MASGCLGAQPWGDSVAFSGLWCGIQASEGTLASSLVAGEFQGHPEYLSRSRGASLPPVLLQKGSRWKDSHTGNGGVYSFNPGIWNAGTGGCLWIWGQSGLDCWVSGHAQKRLGNGVQSPCRHLENIRLENASADFRRSPCYLGPQLYAALWAQDQKP